MIKLSDDYKPKRKGKKTRQGEGRNSKFGTKGSKKYYRKKKVGQGWDNQKNKLLKKIF